MEAPLPPDEGERLGQLQRLRILDSEAEASWDRLVRIAAALCDVPIALVSLIDANRQWFKARVGLGAQETDRSAAFCAHAILDSNQVLEVADATKDARFSDNPLVLGEPDIRFYAGVPVHSPWGQPMGTVCVIDRKPRKLTARQQEGLRMIGEQAEELFRLRYHLLVLKEAGHEYDPDADLRVRRQARRVINEVRHDLVTPLTPMALQVRTLRKAIGDDPQMLGRLDALERNIERLSQVVHNVTKELLEDAAPSRPPRPARKSDDST